MNQNEKSDSLRQPAAPGMRIVEDKTTAGAEMTKEPELCVWKEDEDGNWDTECGHKFTFITDGPKENHFSGCPYCIRKLEVR